MFIGRSTIVIACGCPSCIIICDRQHDGGGEERDAQRRRPSVDSHAARRRAACSGRRSRPGCGVFLAHADRRADEHDADQQVARDLLGPRRRVVQHVAREELVEDASGRAARRSRARPSPRAVVRRGRSARRRVEVALVVEDVPAASVVDRIFMRPSSSGGDVAAAAASPDAASLDRDDPVVVRLA